MHAAPHGHLELFDSEAGSTRVVLGEKMRVSAKSTQKSSDDQLDHVGPWHDHAGSPLGGDGPLFDGKASPGMKSPTVQYRDLSGRAPQYRGRYQQVPAIHLTPSQHETLTGVTSMMVHAPPGLAFGVDGHIAGAGDRVNQREAGELRGVGSAVSSVVDYYARYASGCATVASLRTDAPPLETSAPSLAAHLVLDGRDESSRNTI